MKKSALALTASSALASTGHSASTVPQSKKQRLKESGHELPVLATNQYPWFTFYRRHGQTFEDNLDRTLAEVKKSDADSLEPLLESMQQLDSLCKHLERHSLAMRTVYMNSTLHEKDIAEQSMDTVLSMARRAKSLMDTRIVVTNPSPIRWGGPENKTDEQLAIQSESLEALGKALLEEGISLAYHFHDPEFRMGAREVHHMLASTDPGYVKLCLDAHWAYRGAGDSNIALHDIVKLYGTRIVELHVRQSRNGIWTEAFGAGDIDYNRLVDEFMQLGLKPVICMEQAVEKDSPNSMNALEAHIISHREARKVFAHFL